MTYKYIMTYWGGEGSQPGRAQFEAKDDTDAVVKAQGQILIGGLKLVSVARMIAQYDPPFITQEPPRSE